MSEYNVTVQCRQEPESPHLFSVYVRVQEIMDRAYGEDADGRRGVESVDREILEVSWDKGTIPEMVECACDHVLEKGEAAGDNIVVL